MPQGKAVPATTRMWTPRPPEALGLSDLSSASSRPQLKATAGHRPEQETATHRAGTNPQLETQQWV